MSPGARPSGENGSEYENENESENESKSENGRERESARALVKYFQSSGV